ncbi:Phosphoenolpyruvate synthase [uncultured archaeon]|nr:Phosphoenolpyruvate synthase [uncultured archaeon]
MVVSDNPATRIRLEISHNAEDKKISVGGTCAVANVFDMAGNLAIKPCELAEKAHPSDVWFRLDVTQNNFREGLKEMAKLSHMGFSNFSIMLSGLKEADEIRRARFVAAECGVLFGVEIPFGVSIDSPGMALSYDEISRAGATFAVMDIDSLSKKIMCHEKIQHEIPEPVSKIIESSITRFKQKGIHVAARGNMLESTDVLKELMASGIDSILAHPANFEKIKLKALYAEKHQELDFMKSKMRMHLRPRSR